MEFLEKLFKLKEKNTNIKTEITAGFTTFFTMSYLFVLSPKILSEAGLDFSNVIIVNSVLIFIGSLFMGLYANKPYAIAPFLGESAFIAYVLSPQFSIKGCLSGIFICGILLFLMTLFKLRTYIIKQIPQTIKISFCIGLGLFFIFIAMRDIGIVTLNPQTNWLSTGDFTSVPVILGILSFILIVILVKKGLKSAVLISVVITTIASIITGETQLPDKIFSLHTLSASTFLQTDFSILTEKTFLPILFVIFLLVNIDTSGALISLKYSSDEESDENELKKPMIVDSLMVILAPLIGTTTPGAYIDSMTGIKAGGKTGLTAIITGVLFLTGILFTPLIEIIPPCAYAPALLYVGVLMISVIKKLDFNDISEYAPALFTICTMIFTYNIGSGIIAGFAVYPFIKLLCGQKNKTNKILWILSILSIVYFIIYPN